MSVTKVTPAEFKGTCKFSVYRTSSFTTGSNAFGLVTFDTSEFDTGFNYNTGNGRFTAPVAGYYQVNFGVGFAASSGYLVLGLFKNGTEFKRGFELNVAVTTDTELTGNNFVYLAAADYLTVAIQAPGANTGATGAARTYFNGFLHSTTQDL